MNLLKKIFSPSILIISVFLLIYTFYKSEIIWDGSKRNYYLIYYFIFLILIIFSIITFFINKEIKQYFIISAVTIILSLYVFEAYLYFNKFSKERTYEKQTGIKWDTRNKIEIYKDLKKKDDEVVIYVPPHLHFKNKNNILLPLSGISNSETIFCNENGYYSFYQSDRYGFNNPDSEWNKKEIEYFLVGDSYGHGACVNRPNDIASILRTLSGKPVLNLSYSGYGPLTQYATLREYLTPEVKKILWIYYEGNDLSDLERDLSHKTWLNYINYKNFNQNLKFKQKEIDNLVANLIKQNEIESEKKKDEKTLKYNLINFIKISNIRNIVILSFIQKLEPEKKFVSFKTVVPINTLVLEFKKILKLTNEQVERNNSKLYFVYLPTYNRYKQNYDNSNYDLIKKIVTELNIPFIDVDKEVFKKEKNPLLLFPFGLGGHYNVEGYKKVTQIIYKFSKD